MYRVIQQPRQMANTRRSRYLWSIGVKTPQSHKLSRVARCRLKVALNHRCHSGVVNDAEESRTKYTGCGTQAQQPCSGNTLVGVLPTGVRYKFQMTQDATQHIWCCKHHQNDCYTASDSNIIVRVWSEETFGTNVGSVSPTLRRHVLTGGSNK